MIRNRVSEILGKKRMTVKELQDRTGLSYKGLHLIYWDKLSGMSYDTMEKLCKALSVQPGDLFELVENGE